MTQTWYEFLHHFPLTETKHTLGLRSLHGHVITAHGCTSNINKSPVNNSKAALRSVFLHVELKKYTEQRGTGIENGSEWSNGTVNFRSDRSNREKWPTSKGGVAIFKLFRLDRTDPFSLKSKLPEILVELIAPFVYTPVFLVLV